MNLTNNIKTLNKYFFSLIRKKFYGSVKISFQKWFACGDKGREIYRHYAFPPRNQRKPGEKSIIRAIAKIGI